MSMMQEDAILRKRLVQLGLGESEGGGGGSEDLLSGGGGGATEEKEAAPAGPGGTIEDQENASAGGGGGMLKPKWTAAKALGNLDQNTYKNKHSCKYLTKICTSPFAKTLQIHMIFAFDFQ